MLDATGQRQECLRNTIMDTIGRISVQHTHTHTHTFNGPFSGTTQVSRYQKGKTNLDFTEARDSEWQWHQLGHVQVCTSLQHTSSPPLSFFTGQMPFLPPNQQRQSTEGQKDIHILLCYNSKVFYNQSRIFMIQYDTRCYFNVHSKAVVSQLNHGTKN